MSYSLVNNNLKYELSCGDLLTALATGCSGYPFAVRHIKQSRTESTWLWHKLVAIVEFMPILGGLAALIERIAFACFGSSEQDISSRWRPRSISVEHAFQKMTKNLHKAYVEHFNETPSIDDAVINGRNNLNLELTASFAEEQSFRSDMEDAHFFLVEKDWALVGVFDGHGGKQVSDFAAREFLEKFPSVLKQTDGNVHSAFEKIIHQIHEEVAKCYKWNDQGSTCVVSYIDKARGLVYTATVGDSEAFKVTPDGKMIPLSCVRNWMSKHDLERLKDKHGSAAVENWISRVDENPKKVRSRLYQGVNLSRSIGDLDESALSHKPKITLGTINKGDRILIACDGLYDFASLDEIQRIISGKSSFSIFSLFSKIFGSDQKPLSRELNDAATSKMNRGHCDNVTVGVVTVS